MNFPVVEREDYGNIRIEVLYDECQDDDSPRDWSNVTTIRGWHRRMVIGDGPNIDPDRYEGFGDMLRDIIEEHDAVMVAPLFWYEHSGATCQMGPAISPDDSTRYTDSALARFRAECMDTAGWDSGVAGLVIVSAKDAADMGITDHDDIVTAARQEVETYAAWLRGEVYGYTVSQLSTCEHGDEHADVLDSCWGFVGEPDYCLSEARAVVGWHVANVFRLIAWSAS